MRLQRNDRSTTSELTTADLLKIRWIIEFWDLIRVTEELGATTWGVLERLEREVADALHQDPPDLRKADAATSKAMAHIAGDSL